MHLRSDERSMRVLWGQNFVIADVKQRARPFASPLQRTRHLRDTKVSRIIQSNPGSPRKRRYGPSGHLMPVIIGGVQALGDGGTQHHGPP